MSTLAMLFDQGSGNRACPDRRHRTDTAGRVPARVRPPALVAGVANPCEIDQNVDLAVARRRGAVLLGTLLRTMRRSSERWTMREKTKREL